MAPAAHMVLADLAALGDCIDGLVHDVQRQLAIPQAVEKQLRLAARDRTNPTSDKISAGQDGDIRVKIQAVGKKARHHRRILRCNLRRHGGLPKANMICYQLMNEGCITFRRRFHPESEVNRQNRCGGCKGARQPLYPFGPLLFAKTKAQPSNPGIDGLRKRYPSLQATDDMLETSVAGEASGTFGAACEMSFHCYSFFRRDFAIHVR